MSRLTFGLTYLFLLLRLFLPIIGHSKWLTAKKNGICSSFSSTPFKGGVVTISLELFQKRDRQGKREKIPYNNRTKRTTNLFAKKDATKGCPTLWVENWKKVSYSYLDVWSPKRSQNVLKSKKSKIWNFFLIVWSTMLRQPILSAFQDGRWGIWRDSQ